MNRGYFSTMHIYRTLAATLAVCTLIVPTALAEKVVVQDGATILAYDELEYLVSKWTDQMREVAIQDSGDRLELINLTLTNKKLAAEADKVAEEQPELYWEYISGLNSYKREFLLRQVRDNIEYPDFTALAEEQYRVNKDKVALNPERRLSSHILFASPPGLNRETLTIEAQGVLDELRNGADFIEMVKLHSDEPGAAAKKGLFDRWVKYGDLDVSPPYSEGLFTIEKVGEYAELVNSQFGIHIIRLDGIKESSYKTFAEVKDKLIADYRNEYLMLTMKDYVSSFRMSENAIIDDEAFDKILAPYKPKE